MNSRPRQMPKKIINQNETHSWAINDQKRTQKGRLISTSSQATSFAKGRRQFPSEPTSDFV
jgi:hypothetical protein